MHNGYPIRSNLESSRERRLSRKIEASDEVFGIHRSVAPEDALQLQYALKEIKPKVDKFLDDKARVGAQMFVRENFGLTYVMTHKVNERIRTAFAQGFRLAVLADELQAPDTARDRTLTVSVLDIGWYGRRAKIGGAVLSSVEELHDIESEECNKQTCKKVYSGENAERISKEKSALLGILGEMGLVGVGASGDHISLFEIGARGQRSRLEDHQRQRITDMVQEHLDNRNLFRLRLGPLTVGREYDSSFGIPNGDWDRAFVIEVGDEHIAEGLLD